jgi:hypothetical protein
MRWLGFLLIVASLVACSSEEDELTHTSLYVLPDGRIQVGNVVSEPQAVVGLLGPPSITQIDFVACQLASFRSIKMLLTKVQEAGYTRYGFAHTLSQEDPKCVKR